MLGGGAWSKCPLGRAPARLLCLLRVRLAALQEEAGPQEDAGPLGGQPLLPRVFELAASEATDSLAFDHSGGA